MCGVKTLKSINYYIIKHRKITILTLVIVLLLFVSSRSPAWFLGEGRGDWTVTLNEGYAISKINSKEILLIHKNNPEDSGGTIVISNYFVLAYQQQNSYVCLKGICTQGKAITEDELSVSELSYFLVNTKTNSIIGPLKSSNDFVEQCRSLGIEAGEWTHTKKT